MVGSGWWGSRRWWVSRGGGVWDGVVVVQGW